MESTLALNGGMPVRKSMLQYGMQSIDDSDRKAVDDVLRGKWLTTGPNVRFFEDALCAATGAKHAIAVNTGTAALHTAAAAAGIRPGDEVIVPVISFVASSNCVLYQGANPVFADLSPDTLNIDPDDVARKITSKTRGIVAVDFCGHPCDHDALRKLAKEHGIPIIEDAAHALGAVYKGSKVGTIQDFTTFSFHPVKHITTGEGGAILTDDDEKAKQMRSFRHHGIDLDFMARGASNSWGYDVTTLGCNYRLSDINCALGTSQLKKQDVWLARRRKIVELYGKALADIPMLQLPTERPDCHSAWHIYIVRLNLEMLKPGIGRKEIFEALRSEGIGVNVHYIPIPWMTLYSKLGYTRGNWPVAEHEYERMLTLPIYPTLTDNDISDVVEAMRKVWHAWGEDEKRPRLTPLPLAALDIP